MPPGPRRCRFLGPHGDRVSSTDPAARPALRQAVIVDRSSPASRAAATDRMRDAALDPRRPQIVIFPEGSTTNRAALCRFKPCVRPGPPSPLPPPPHSSPCAPLASGAFLPLQPVQPVLTDFSAGPVDGSWTHEGATLGRTMVLLASRPVSWITYTFLPPVLPPASPVGAPTPDVETGSDSANRSLVADSPDSQQWMGDAARREAAEAFAERVRVTMADAGQLPLSNVLFDDVLMLDRAKRLRFPPSACLVELLSLRPHVRVRTRFAIACVSHFVMLSRGRLHVDEESFRERAPLPNLVRPLVPLCVPPPQLSRALGLLCCDASPVCSCRTSGTACLRRWTLRTAASCPSTPSSWACVCFATRPRSGPSGARPYSST